jgi:hypothetical protein
MGSNVQMGQAHSKIEHGIGKAQMEIMLSTKKILGLEWFRPSKEPGPQSQRNDGLEKN